MAGSPESLIFHALKTAGAPSPSGGAPASSVRSDDEAMRLTNAVLTTLHQAGYRIVRREDRER